VPKSEIRRWLERLGLGKYGDVFEEHCIDIDVLPDLTEDDLARIAIPLGDRKRLIRAIGSGGVDDASSVVSVDEAEQRQLTLMFADLVGSTALSARLDLEQYHDVLAPYLEGCAAIVREHQGYIAQFQGDCILAYFGFPRASEDDAAQAAAAGLAIVEAAAAIRSAEGVSMQARVGIATGVVLVSDLLGVSSGTQRSVMGETPNRAARLQTAAEPGTVVVDRDTRALLGEAFVCEDLGEAHLKGFSEPVSLWKVGGLQPSGTRFERRRRGALTPFVNREEEIELLLRRWNLAKAGEGQTVLIAGEAGIGKSRLVQMLCEQIAPEPLTRMRHQCSPNHMGSPLHPIIAQLELAAGFASSDSREERLDKLETLLAQGIDDVPAAARVLARLLSIPAEDRYPPLKLAARQIKEATLQVLLDQLHSLTRRGPVLVIFEDVHWIDPTTQELLDLLIDRIPTLPALLVCTYRQEHRVPWTGESRVTTLSLRRFDGRQSAAVIESVSGGLPVQVADRIVAKTDGVPLFLEELTKAVLESGSLRLEEGRYVLGGQLDALTLPSTLQGSLLARLDRLPGASSVAPVGAAIGRTFSYELLAAVSGLDDDVLQPILRRLIEAQLLFQKGTLPEATFTFKHALVQDAAYATLLKRRREALHAKIAATLREKFPDVVVHKPEVMAYHCTRANLAAEALEHWRRAAAIAVQNSANAEAIAHIEAALEQNEQVEGADERIANEIALRELLCVPLEARSWGSRDIERNLRRLHVLVKKTNDRSKILSVSHGLCGVYILSGRMSAAQKVARRMSNVAYQGQEIVFQLLSERSLGMCHFFSGDFDEAIIHFDRAIALASRAARREARVYYVADPRLVAQCMSAWARLLRGDHAEALRRAQSATRVAEAHRHIFSRIYAFGILASFHQSRDDAPAALHFASLAATLSREHGNRYWEAWAQIVKGWALTAIGKHDDGISQLIDGIGKYADTGSRLILRYARTLLAEAYGRAGQVAEGLRIAHELDDAQAGREVRFFDSCAERIVARLRAAADDEAASRGPSACSPPPDARSAPDNSRAAEATRSGEDSPRS
jgi:predicted ATPase/class 3 adenylate cyclase